MITRHTQTLSNLYDCIYNLHPQNDKQYAKLENADILELVLHQLKIANGCSTPNGMPATETAASPVFSPRDGHLHDSPQFQSGIDLCATETIKFLRHFGPPAKTASVAAATQNLPIILKQQPIPTQTISPINTVDDDVLDLRVNCSVKPESFGCIQMNSDTEGAKHVHTEKQMQPQQHPLQLHYSPARRDVLDKIRRKIFEKKAVLEANGGQNQLPHRPAAGQAVEQLDDGYDSDEAICMWRPW